ncbi:MAG: hypothetical protein JKY37_30005 [Nannocystaceae bacterium]|nr:hypothetical protein [Nannocystaceae bacterium]
MAVEDKTMFEIYRETDYNRAFHSIFYTELEEHARESAITKAASGKTVFSAFIHDEHLEAARGVIGAIVDELNDMDEDDASMSDPEIRGRLEAFLAPAP